MTRTFLYIFTFALCVDVIGQAIGRFLWTPVVRPYNYQPKKGVNRFDPTKQGQSFTHSSRWGNYPNQFKPTQKSVQVGNSATTVRGRGYPAGSPRSTSKGIAGVAPTLQLHGPPQRVMPHTESITSDFILDYRTDTLTSSKPHKFQTGDMVKFDLLPQISSAQIAGNERNPRPDPAENPLPGLLNSKGHYVKWTGFDDSPALPGGERSSSSDLNSTLFAVRKLDDWRIQLFPDMESALDGPRQIFNRSTQGVNETLTDYNGSKPSNFVINTPVIGHPDTGAPVTIQQITRTPYTLAGWKDICVNSDSVTHTFITDSDAANTLTFTTGAHNLVNGQGVFFDNNPPAGLDTGTTYYARLDAANPATVITLHTTHAGALGNTDTVDITAGSMIAAGTAPTYSLFKAFHVNSGANYFERANHGLVTGDVVYMNRTRWTPKNADETAAAPITVNEHFYVSVSGNQVWLHTNLADAAANGDVGPGANVVTFNFNAMEQCIGDKALPIYAKRTQPWEWRRERLSQTAITFDVDVDDWSGLAHPGSTGALTMVTQGGTLLVDQNANTISWAQHNWRTRDRVVFETLPNGTLPPGITAGTNYYVNNNFENAGIHTTITIHLTPAEAQAGINAVDLTGTGDALWAMWSPTKCFVPGGHVLETGDRVRVDSGNAPPATVVPSTGGTGNIVILGEYYVSVRSIDPNVANDAWVYFHTSHFNAVYNEVGTWDAPGILPITIFTGSVQTPPGTFTCYPYKLQMADNNKRLRSGDVIVFSANPPTTLPFTVAQQPRFASVSRGNNNFDQTEANWGNLKWNDMGGLGRGNFHRGNDDAQWWLHLHQTYAAAVSRTNPQNLGQNAEPDVGNGSDQIDISALPVQPALFHDYNATDAIDANSPGGASPEWAAVTTGTPVTIAAIGANPLPTATQTVGGFEVPVVFNANVMYISKSGVNNKDITLHTTQDSAMGLPGAVDTALHWTTAGGDFRLAVADRMQIRDASGNNPLQNGDRIRFMTDPPTVPAPDQRPLNRWDVDNTTPGNPTTTEKYTYYYVSIDENNPADITLHETYADAVSGMTRGNMIGLGSFSIPHNGDNETVAPDSSWQIDFIRPPRITSKSRFQTISNNPLDLANGLPAEAWAAVHNHNLNDGDFLYFAPHQHGRLPSTWDPNDFTYKGLELNRPYRVTHANLGSIDKNRGIPFLNPEEPETGKATGYDGWLSTGDNRGKAFQIEWDQFADYGGSEAQIIEDVNSSAQLRRIMNRGIGSIDRPIWSDPTLEEQANDPEWAATYAVAAGRPANYFPEHAFSAFKDNGTVAVRLRTNNSQNALDNNPSNNPIDIDLSMTARREYRSEYRLRFIRHNFYHAGVPENVERTNIDATHGGYWNDYRYYATYEAYTARSNRAGLEANATFYVVGIPREVPDIIIRAADGTGTYQNNRLINPDALRNIIPVSGFHFGSNAWGPFGDEPALPLSPPADYSNATNPNAQRQPDPIYFAPHLVCPWRSPAPGNLPPYYVQNGRDGWDPTIWLNAGYHPSWFRTDSRFPNEPKSQKLRYIQGPVASAAEAITHPEDLDMANLISVTRTVSLDAQNGNALQWLNPAPFNDLWGDGALVPFTNEGASREDPDYSSLNLGANSPIATRDNLVGIREYDRNTGYLNTRLFGDFFVNPAVATTTIVNGNTAGSNAGANQIPNTVAIPGVVPRNNLISTRNLSEVMKLGDLGVKVRRMNRLPSMFGPEYIFANQFFDVNRQEWVVELNGNRIVLAR